MNRYTAQIMVYVGVVIMVWIVVSSISAIIWRFVLKHGGDYPRIRRFHIRLAVLMPTALIIFNVISRNLFEPHATLLWAYFIMPFATTLPFLASLTGLRLVKN